MAELEQVVAGTGRATLKEVAGRAGVSINTASVVLNPRRNQSVVHPDTRARVQEAARALGYRRNLAASRLAGGAANTFCILTDRMTNPFHAAILDAVVAEASREGFQCVLGRTGATDPKDREYIRGLAMQGVDGFLLMPVWEDPAIAELLPGLLEGPAQALFVDYRFPGHAGPLVACDHRAGARLLAEHLVAQGHRRVVYLHGASAAPAWSIAERIAGAAEVITAAGGGLEVVAGVAAAGDRLKMPTPPTAIMCANDQLAYSLMAGLEVTDRVAVTGFDDVGSDRPALWETLTTVRQPLAEIGRRAASELIAIARGHTLAPDTDILLPGALILRESTAQSA